MSGAAVGVTVGSAAVLTMPGSLDNGPQPDSAHSRQINPRILALNFKELPESFLYIDGQESPAINCPALAA